MTRTCAFLLALFVGAVHAEPPRLLPFQGRLTGTDGNPLADGAKVVQFVIFDKPTAGTVKWSGEVQMLTVNGGLVSTLLGSKASLEAVDFNQPLYLEITIDANGDNQITPADPPLLPRQSILPAVFAVEAQSARDSSKLQGFDWNAVFDNGDPATGKINGSKLASSSVSSNQLAPNLTLAGGTSGAFAGSFSGNGAALTSLTTANLNGLIQAAQLTPGAVNGQSLFADDSRPNGMKWGTGWQMRHALFTASGNFVTPTGTTTDTVFRITCIGAGGAGAAGAGSTGGGGGGGGGTAIKFLSGLAPGTSKVIIVGAGGASVSIAGTRGADGGHTSFGTECTAGGGKGGESTSGIVIGGRGGIGTAGDILIGGSSGSGGYTVSGVGNIGGAGGGTTMGGGGQPGASTTAGGSGLSFGGGGGGSQGGSPSGAGASGVVLIEWNQ